MPAVVDEVIGTIRLIAPEFDGVAKREIKKWVELCAPLVSSKRFGSLYIQALAYLVAHRMKLTGIGVAEGEDPLGDIGKISGGALSRVGSFSEGDTSISFNSSSSQQSAPDADLALTQYGVQYLSLRRMRVLPIISAGERNGWA